jgi:hypothetical protein
MARPIESTILSGKDFSRLLKKLESPKLSPLAQEMYEKGRVNHKRLHRA